MRSRRKVAVMIQNFKIDLVSDTSTKPTEGMRQAMAYAEVGDEQRGEDPTVNTLNARAAELLGKEAALFLPSGTMCNQIAVAVHCRPGDEILAAESAHLITLEGAGAAVLAGSFIRGIPTDNGIFSVAQLAEHMREKSVKAPVSRVVAIEQTTNRGGGAVWPLAHIQDVARFADEHGLIMHMDGARLMNAVVASGVSAQDFCAPFESAWLDLSKGLGCPIGGVLAGSKAFIEAANFWKFRLGGAMRQAGIIAAAGLYALDHHVERLAEDHANAQFLAEVISDLPGLELMQDQVETNIVFFSTEQSGRTAREVADQLYTSGIRIGVESTYIMRALTHLDVSRDDILDTGRVLADILKS